MSSEADSKTDVLYEVSEHVATITFNCPERQNTISGPMLRQLTDALVKASEAPEVRVIVLTGTGRAFCAGLNLEATLQELDNVLAISCGGGFVLALRDDGRPGSISFYDPRVGMNMNAIRKDPYVLYHHTESFVPGLLMIWPAYVPVFIHPHLHEADAMRIRIDVQAAAENAG